ncbi:hypothetical protein J4526_06685 [Desulfurococcaceae archaeon MEX13E-LK6-19]|nr:hypothetical protein J4526_06685 [Desulfurococcaceae archaeon MEX13E-LK6-19]
MYNFKEVLEDLCKKKVWLFCRFLDFDAPMLHKYLVVTAESYQYLGETLCECLNDKHCSGTLAIMVREVMLLDEYYPRIDVDKLSEVLRKSFKKYI